jgi:hypothetical protein
LPLFRRAFSSCIPTYLQTDWGARAYSQPTFGHEREALLLKSAIDALASEGFNVAEILDAMKQRRSCISSLNRCKRGMKKQIVVSIVGREVDFEG